MSENSFIIFHAKENPTFPGNLDKRNFTKGAVKCKVSVLKFIIIGRCYLYTIFNERYHHVSFRKLHNFFGGWFVCVCNLFVKLVFIY